MVKRIFFCSKLLTKVVLTFLVFHSIQAQRSTNYLYEGRKSIVKVNLSSLAFNSYQFQAERVLIKPISIGFTYIRANKASVPLAEDTSLILFDNSDDFDDDLVFLNMISTASITGNSFMPEIRFYLGKGFGKGFYLAPFYKHSDYDLNNVEIVEFSRDDGTIDNLVTSGNLSSNSFGLLIGTQFNLGSRIILDFFLGPHVGNYSGGLVRTFDNQLSFNEQLELDSELEAFNLPLNSEANLEITSDGASIDSSGNWFGIRAGMSIGMRF